MRSSWIPALFLAALPITLVSCKPAKPPATSGDAAQTPPGLAPRGDVVEVLHGVEVADPYRWMEDAEAQAVTTWSAERNADFQAYTDALPQRQVLYDRFQHLWRYDDESTPQPCLLSERIVYRTKKADEDKWVVHIKDGPDAEGRVVIDPNSWEQTQTLAGFYPSPDCKYAAYGKANAGDENPVITVIDLDTLEPLPDTLQGRRQRSASWRHDNAGFYYSANPREGELGEGDHEYFHRVWYHQLGTGPDADELVFHDPEVKEHFHMAGISEDGRWLVRARYKFSKNGWWLQDLEGGGEHSAGPVPIATDMENDYRVEVVDGRLFITTDWEAPNYRVMTTTVDKPGREHWVEFLPETEDKLNGLSPIAGKLYADYDHDASTLIRVYDIDGSHLHDIPLPTTGSAGVWGHWSKPTVWLSFTSFAFPTTVYTYDAEANALTLYKESPIDIDPSGIVAEQVRYLSRDGTEVTMFLIHHEDAPQDGSVPYLLTGYGGFNISLTPHFSTTKAVWVQSGGGIAIPNLRGGGEYGRAWHEAGMHELKQNVFDDFLAAAEYLVAEGHTSSDRLAIAGGSNGGLLVGAAVTQRPDLFTAVLCQQPLIDMVRFHHFGLANIWTEEYGSADDPEMFPHIHAYSPYHRVVEGTDYPAVLVTGSTNDARTKPVHALKFVAALRWADTDHGGEQPILLHLQSESGHGGGVGIDVIADQVSRHFGFLMGQIGMVAVDPTAE